MKCTRQGLAGILEDAQPIGNHKATKYGATNSCGFEIDLSFKIAIFNGSVSGSNRNQKPEVFPFNMRLFCRLFTETNPMIYGANFWCITSGWVRSSASQRFYCASPGIVMTRSPE